MRKDIIIDTIIISHIIINFSFVGTNFQFHDLNE